MAKVYIFAGFVVVLGAAVTYGVILARGAKWMFKNYDFGQKRWNSNP